MFNFKPTVLVSYYYDQILVSKEDIDYAFFLNNDRSLRKQDAALLEEKKIGNIEGKSLFDFPELCHSIFNWDHKLELSFIKNFMKPTSKALDCGCGYGRLLHPLNKQGFKVDGVDISYSSILFLKDKLTSENINAQLYCCPIDNFIIPDYYDFAFSALNTLRYLKCISSIKRHLICISKSLRKGGIYLFNVSVLDHRHLEYNITWNFFYRKKKYTVKWCKSEHDYFSNTLTDFIQIFDKKSGVSLIEEEQTQFIFTSNILSHLFREISNLFSLTQIYNEQFSAVESRQMPINGNYWFQLERK